VKKWQRFRRKGERVVAQPQPHGAVAATTAAPATPAARANSSGGHRRGVLLDLTVVIANLFLIAPLVGLLRAQGQGFLAPTGGERRVGPKVGWLLLSVFAAHAAGAFLKRPARLARLAAGGRVPPARPTGRPIFWIVCALLLAHFTIFLFVLMSGWQGAGLDGWVSVFGKGGRDAHPFFAFLVRFALVCFVLPLPTLLVAISLAGAGDAPRPSWRTHWATEFFADLLLYFSIVVLTAAMNVLIAPRFETVAGGSGPTAGDVLASLIPLALAFSLFYLPPRLIYLAEDYRSPLTWLTILLALLSLAYRTFFPDSFSW
jgi:hypothetical protein